MGYPIEMTEERFWELVAKVNWGQRHEEYKELKTELMHELTPEEGGDMYSMYMAKSRAIGKAIREYCDERDTYIGIGGDSSSDLFAHIVGLGREIYEDELANPEKIFQRGKDGEYVESFAYVIPTERDFENTNLDKYVNRAKKFIENHSKVLDDYKYSKEYKDEFRNIFSALRCLVGRNVAAFMGAEEEITEVAEKVLGSGKWSILNIYSDLKSYYLPFNPIEEGGKLIPSEDEKTIAALEKVCPGTWERVDPNCMLAYRVDFALYDEHGRVAAGVMTHEVHGPVGQIPVGMGFLQFRGDSLAEVAAQMAENETLQERLQS